ALPGGSSYQPRAAWFDEVGEESTVQQPLPTPILLRTISAGQKPVKADWIRFTATKTASQSQLGFTQWASPRLTSTSVPARIRIEFSSFIDFCAQASAAGRPTKWFHFHLIGSWSLAPFAPGRFSAQSCDQPFYSRLP